MAAAWTGGAGAQSSDPSARKDYIECSAVFGTSSVVAGEARQKDALAGAALNLTRWAGDLDPSPDRKAASDRVANELSEALRAMGDQLRAAKAAPEQQRKFEQRLQSELERCMAVYRKGRDRRADKK
jgi:hypothetical protein